MMSTPIKQTQAAESPSFLDQANDLDQSVNAEPVTIMSNQKPVDLIDEASMESFPCSDPPAYTTTHS